MCSLYFPIWKINSLLTPDLDCYTATILDTNFTKNGGRKDKQKIWHTENCKRTYRELKNAEVIMKYEIDDYKYENSQSVAEILKKRQQTDID